ncbi:hypothetical protein [Leptolyngbya sp. 7M]|uniref:hypothetical protein n=1 Tax=Leptolyngbya sp. 7M TaxID=2812896 RepID=UPI001B8B2C9D|nr:hypothetical protein [Leptolyngbya sp. 7M]QYO64933.1 hypothetical protein JVX88_36300 [Leptolyngbya sp. 7M]
MEQIALYLLELDATAMSSLYFLVGMTHVALVLLAYRVHRIRFRRERNDCPRAAVRLSNNNEFWLGTATIIASFILSVLIVVISVYIELLALTTPALGEAYDRARRSGRIFGFSGEARMRIISLSLVVAGIGASACIGICLRGAIGSMAANNNRP